MLLKYNVKYVQGSTTDVLFKTHGHQKMANRALAAVSSLDSSLDDSLMRTKEWA